MMAHELHELQKSVIGEWSLVNGEVVPFGPIVYAFGDETNHHSTTHHSTKMVHRLHIAACGRRPRCVLCG